MKTCRYGNTIYIYNEATDNWDQYDPSKESEMLAENTKRLEKRSDMQEIEIEELKEENRRLSMRLRRLEINEHRRDNEYGSTQKMSNVALWTGIASLAGFVLWSNGIIDAIVSSF